MIKRIRFYNIVLETDGKEIKQEDITLDVDEYFDEDEEGADLISNETDYLVESFDWEELQLTPLEIRIEEARECLEEGYTLRCCPYCEARIDSF